MVDIETLGLERNAVILSIGAVWFGAGAMGETFHASISRESCEAAGLVVDEDTLEWWRDQDADAREVLTGGDDLADVLADFTTWVDGADEVWANSPSFDCEALEFAGDAVGVEMPWPFYQERDFRTLKELPVAADIEQNGTEHDALDDAKHQAHVAAATLRRLEQADFDTKPEGSENGD
jgi:hypothetical protein